MQLDVQYPLNILFEMLPRIIRDCNKKNDPSNMQMDVQYPLNILFEMRPRIIRFINYMQYDFMRN